MAGDCQVGIRKRGLPSPVSHVQARRARPHLGNGCPRRQRCGDVPRSQDSFWHEEPKQSASGVPLALIARSKVRYLDQPAYVIPAIKLFPAGRCAVARPMQVAWHDAVKRHKRLSARFGWRPLGVCQGMGKDHLECGEKVKNHVLIGKDSSSRPDMLNMIDRGCVELSLIHI